MRKFAIFAGLGGSFGGAGFHGVYEYNDEADAEKDAYMKAEEEYQSYEGCHGIMSWDECYEDAKEAEWFDESFSQNDIEDIVDTHYLEQIESWAVYYVREVHPDTPEGVSEEEVEDWFLTNPVRAFDVLSSVLEGIISSGAVMDEECYYIDTCLTILEKVVNKK